MERKYYTLAVREDGKWSPEFGDYNRKTVEHERTTYWHKRLKDLKIVTSGDSQAEINAAIAELNR